MSSIYRPFIATTLLWPVHQPFWNNTGYHLCTNLSETVLVFSIYKPFAETMSTPPIHTRFVLIRRQSFLIKKRLYGQFTRSLLKKNVRHKCKNISPKKCQSHPFLITQKVCRILPAVDSCVMFFT